MRSTVTFLANGPSGCIFRETRREGVCVYVCACGWTYMTHDHYIPGRREPSLCSPSRLLRHLTPPPALFFSFSLVSGLPKPTQDLSLVVQGSTGKRNAKNVPYTQFFVTAVTDEAGKCLYTFISLQPVAGLEAEPSQTMVSSSESR